MAALLNTMHGPAVKSSIGSLTTEATLTGCGLATGVLFAINKGLVASDIAPMFDLRTHSIAPMFDLQTHSIAGLMTALLSVATEATITGTAIYPYTVAAAAPKLTTGVNLKCASGTKPTLDPLTDAKPGLPTALMLTYVSTETALTRALSFVNTARPSVGHIIMTPIKSLNTEADVKLHAAATVNYCATFAAAANQAVLLTRNYSPASAW